MEGCTNCCRCSTCLVDPMLEEVLVYLNKRDSEEEILRNRRKKESEVMGYNQEAIKVGNDDSIEPKKKVVSSQDNRDMDMALASELELKLKFSSASIEIIKRPSTLLSKLQGTAVPGTGEACNSSRDKGPKRGGTNIGVNDVKKGNYQKFCISSSKSAVIRLFEICDANKWNAPEFVLWKEEGTLDQKRYTFKVTVKVGTSTSTLVECFSEPRSENVDARRHAAEGALWVLKHLRYT